MKLTVEQALQQGIAAHKEGKLQDAEALYRAILNKQPNHPDANHNLGLLAVGLDKVQEALPFFKLALETNPKQGQFWVSYIDALIQLGQLDNARKILKKGQASGLKGDKVDQLAVKLSSTVDSASPPIGIADNSRQQQIDYLIALYNQGDLDEALIKGNMSAEQFPDEPIIPIVLFLKMSKSRSLKIFFELLVP